MNYYLWGQLFGKITSIVGIGSFIIGLITSKHKFLLTAIFFFTLIELFVSIIIFNRVILDNEMTIFVIVLAGFIAGYIPFSIKKIIFQKNKPSNQSIDKINKILKKKVLLVFKLTVSSFLIISATIFVLSFIGGDLAFINILLIWLYLIPVVLLFLTILYILDWGFTNASSRNEQIKKRLSKSNINYFKSFFDVLFSQINELSKNNKRKKNKIKKQDIFWIAPIIILIIAIFPIPVGYYNLTRLLVSACALYYAIHYYKKKNTTNAWIYGFIVALYNPINPIFLYDKFIWIVVNLITILVFYKIDGKNLTK